MISSLIRAFNLVAKILGLEWINRSYTTRNTFNGACFGNGTHLVCGTSSVISSVNLGVTWTLRTTGLTQTKQDCAFGNNTFVVISGLMLAYSTNNCISWNTVDTSSFPIMRITFGNGIFVGYIPSLGKSAISSNGIDWTISETMIPTSVYKNIEYCNGVFLLAGKNTSTNLPCIFKSTDGLTWSIAYTTSTYYSTYPNAYFTNTRYSALTDRITCTLYLDNANSKLYYTDDLANWTTYSQNVGSGKVGVAYHLYDSVYIFSTNSLYAYDFNSGSYVYYISTGGYTFNDICYSDDNLIIVGENKLIYTS